MEFEGTATLRHSEWCRRRLEPAGLRVGAAAVGLRLSRQPALGMLRAVCRKMSLPTDKGWLVRHDALTFVWGCNDAVRFA